MNAFFASVFTKENTEHYPAVKQHFQGEENEKLRTGSFNITSDMVKSKPLKKSEYSPWGSLSWKDHNAIGAIGRNFWHQNSLPAHC